MSKYCLIFVMALSPLATNVHAQDAGATAFVPDTAVVSMRSRPAMAFTGPGSEYMPTEILQAAGKRYFGIDPLTIVETKVIVGKLNEDSIPLFGMLIRLQDDYDLSSISPELLVEPEPKQIDGRKVYVVGNPQDPWYAYSVDAKTVFLAIPPAMELFADAQQGSDGPLAQLITANSMAGHDSQTIIAIEPAREFVIEQVNQLLDDAPPDFRQLARVPEILDAIIFSSAAGDDGANSLRLELICRDAAATKELQQILDRSIEKGRAMAVAAMTNDIEGDGRMQQAQLRVPDSDGKLRCRLDSVQTRQRQAGHGVRTGSFPCVCGRLSRLAVAGGPSCP